MRCPGLSQEEGYREVLLRQLRVPLRIRSKSAVSVIFANDDNAAKILTLLQALSPDCEEASAQMYSLEARPYAVDVDQPLDALVGLDAVNVLLHSMQGNVRR